MDKFYFEIPSIERKEDAIDYIKEHLKYNSKINGTGGLKSSIDDYEGWLKQLEINANIEPSEKIVPERTFFLVRESDNRIVGMINIRTRLNEKLSKYGGHIGYGIRPTERGKGYNKINLYLGLKFCLECGIDKVFLDAALNNLASWKTMEALGGKRIKEYFKEDKNDYVVGYIIDTKDSLEKYKNVYEQLISKDRTK